MKRIYIAAIVFMPFLFFSCSKGANKKAEKFVIFYTGNIGGKTNPCGCTPPLGGFARRATVLKSMRNYFKNILALDSGAMLYETNYLTPPIDYIFNLRAPVIAQIADQIGLDAANVSSFDLSNSADSLLALDRLTSFPWLSANLTWRKTGGLVFAPDKVIPMGTIHIGVFGLMADNYMGAKLYDESSPLLVLDYIETAKKEVSKLKKDCDVIIALTYMSMKDVEELCDKVSGIQFIVFSHNGKHTPSADHVAFAPVKRGKTVILRCPDGGRVIGEAIVEMVNGSTDFVEFDSDVYYAENALNKKNKSWESQSIYVNTFINFGSEIRKDDAIQAKINTVEHKVTAFRDSISMQ